MAERVLFIINPIAGGRSKKAIPGLISRYLNKALYKPHIMYTRYAGHAHELAQAALPHYRIIAAVGGDGTINEVAGALAGSNCCLAIIPLGSGNGLARYLKLPLDARQAIKLINTGSPLRIDTALFNKKHFFNVAGIGFDGLVSAAFAQDKQRGFITYLKVGLQQFTGYVPKTYSIVIDGQPYIRKALAISIANSSQYGNNVHIAPGASVTDGMLDVCIIKPLNLMELPIIGFVMLNRLAGKSPFIEIIKGQNIRITTGGQAEAIHLDGEALPPVQQADIKILPCSLNIICPA